MIHLRLLLSILVLSTSVISVTNDDFIALEVKIKEFINQNPDRRIPLLVRNSFHDLFLQNRAAYHGCIMANKEFVKNIENAGLETINDELKAVIDTNFADTGFSLGDVVAFAGKVAVEAAYPCVNVDFKFNRGSCQQEIPIDANEAPSAFIDTVRGLRGMFNYLGGAITPEDLAILFAGAHGIKGARSAPSGWFGVFATVTSGKDFIEKTFNSIWKGTSEGTLFQFFTGDTFNPESSIIRLPSDLIFYPSKVPKGSKRDDSAEAKAVENTLRGFLNKDRSVFDVKFAQVFSKMLAIGNGNITFVSNSKSNKCGATTSVTSTMASTTSVTSTMASTTSVTSTVASTTTTMVVPTKSSTTNPAPSTTKSTTTTAVPTFTSSTKVETSTSKTASSSTSVTDDGCRDGYDDCVLSGSYILSPFMDMMASIILLCLV